MSNEDNVSAFSFVNVADEEQEDEGSSFSFITGNQEEDTDQHEDEGHSSSGRSIYDDYEPEVEPYKPTKQVEKVEPYKPTKQVEKVEINKPTKQVEKVPVVEQEKKEEHPTVEVRLRMLQKTFSEWRTKIEELTHKQLHLINERKQLNYILIEKYKQINEDELKQTEKIDSDAFEEAERLNEELKEVKNKIKEIQNDIIDLSRRWISLEDEKNASYVKLLGHLRREGINELKILEEEQMRAVEEIKKALRDENQDTEYQNREQRIERDMMHICTDLDILDEKYVRIQNAVIERTTPSRQKKQMWTEKKNALEENIQELLAKIDALRNEQKECNIHIAAADEEIDHVSSRYQKDLDGIEQERSRFLAEKANLEKEEQMTKKIKESYQIKINALNTKVEEEEKLFNDIELAIKNSRDTIEALDMKTIESNEMKLAAEALLEQDIREQAEIKKLREHVDSLGEESESLLAQINQLQTNIHSIEQNNKGIEESLPNLDNQKKLAAKSRNFKAAQALLGQINTLQEQLKENQEKMQITNEQLQQTTAKYEANQKQYNMLEKEVKEKEKEIDQKKAESILIRILSLKEQMKRIPQNEESEQQFIMILLETERAKLLHIQLKHNLTPFIEGEIPETTNQIQERKRSNTPQTIMDKPTVKIPKDDSKVDNLIHDLSQLSEEERNSKLEHFQSELNSLEESLEKAVDDENYIKADEIQSEIDELQKILNFKFT